MLAMRSLGFFFYVVPATSDAIRLYLNIRNHSFKSLFTHIVRSELNENGQEFEY